VIGGPYAPGSIGAPHAPGSIGAPHALGSIEAPHALGSIEAPHALRRVLVIKHGALGDIVLATGPFAAIRRHHREAEISLLTTKPYGDWLGRSGYFDAVSIDERPPSWNLLGWLAVRRWLIEGRFDRVYDLQTSSRSSRYFRLLPRRARPQWSGIARGCSHPDADPDRDRRHTIDRQRGQLAACGITDVPMPDLSWATADIGRFGLTVPFVLLVPGGSAHRPEKRWPIAHYRTLAERIAASGLLPVVIGGPGERPLGREVRDAVPDARDLTGDTSFDELASLARAARCAVGNDTGPMHIVAASCCPSVVLFSAASDPALTAPRGDHVTILRRDRIGQLEPAEVDAVLRP
jgi:ADP-heptose:LPS heptosyltransferase